MTELEIAKFISSQKTSIAKLFKEGKEELSNFLDDGVHNYLENQRIKYSTMKTFLFRNETVDFNKIYFPIEISNYYNTSKGVYNLLDTKKKIIVSGTAGSGKSMLMVNVFFEALRNKYKIPLIIELRNLKYHDFNLVNYISEYILEQKIKPNSKILNRALSEGKFVILLDGYDEIDFKYEGKVYKEIVSFSDKYVKNDIIITTRPGTSILSAYRFETWFVDPLSDDDILAFIKQQTKTMQETPLGEKIIDAISKKENFQYQEFLGNPLLLSMFIFTYKFNPELPKTKSKFYWNVFDTLCTKHDSITKGGGYLHNRRSGLTVEEIENVLMWFSYVSFFESKFSFDEKYFFKIVKEIKNQLRYSFEIGDLLYDLKVNISILTQDGLLLKFPHRSIQEYFVALLISTQPDDTKEKIYSTKIKKSLPRGLYTSNLLALCNELDRVCLLSYLILPLLKNFQNKIKGNNDESNMAENFCKFIELQVDFQFSKHLTQRLLLLSDKDLLKLFYENLDDKGFSMRITIDDYKSEIAMIFHLGFEEEFHNCYKKFSYLCQFDRIGKPILVIYRHASSLQISLKLKRGLNDYLKVYVQECGMQDKIQNLYTSLSNKVEELDQEIELIQEGSNNLLGI